MAAHLLAAALHGVDAIPIEVEVDLLSRLPHVSIVGLAASSVKESAERVRSAIEAFELEFPKRRVVVNLAPADVPKDGTAFDLPLALAILAANGQIPSEPLADLLVAGELSLNGRLRRVRGALSVALLARDLGKTAVLPRASAVQAALVPGVRIVAADDLGEVVQWLRGKAKLGPVAPNRRVRVASELDLSEVRGQQLARRALEIAAAGAHHSLLVGPPGCGKSMLARRLATILPPLDFEEALSCTRVHAVAGLLEDDPSLMADRPFRAPHHSVTVAGLIGDRTLRPGEVSLAHNGVLFLDEATEFGRHALEVLREPLEDGRVRLTRAQGSVEYPAVLTLVMAANPCPCGFRGSPRICRCTDGQVAAYQRRLSGPILDRIDLHVALQPVPATTLLDGRPGESSAAVRTRVVAARQRQAARGQSAPNGRLGASETADIAWDDGARRTLRLGAEHHQLSSRAAMRLLKVARTIADLAAEDAVGAEHIAEALAFRPGHRI